MKGSTLYIQAQGSANPILRRAYTIDEAGNLKGLTQFANARELEDEILRLLMATNTALLAYYAEWNVYSADLNQLGVAVSPYLGRFGNLKVILENGGYRIEFTGTAYPINGKVFSRR